ncbi:MAG: Rab family GTPase [Promethearchaeota archaeon]
MSKIVIIGQGAVGKTCICKRIKGYPFEKHYIPTIAFDYQEMKFHIQDGELNLKIWDLGGQRSFFDSIPLILRGVDLGIIVYDIRNVSESELEKYYNLIFSYNNETVSIMAVGNKTDLINNENYEIINRNRIIVNHFCEKHGLINIETSAKTLKNFEYVQDSLINYTNIDSVAMSV